MGVQKLRLRKTLFLAGAILLLSACNQLDTVLPSAGTYQVSVLVNQLSLDEYSIISAGDELFPYFASPVGNDPDLTSLVVYLESSGRKAVGNRVYYTLEAPPVKESEEKSPKDAQDDQDDHIIRVDDFTSKLPPFPLPVDLAIGSYTLVFEIRGKEDVLSKISRPIYYLGDKVFTTEDIRCYLPGLYENNHLVPQGVTVMLETRVSYDKDLDPYIIWYNGAQRIGEGSVAAGAAQLLWKAPQQTGFHIIRAELFPFKPQTSLKGKIRELSLPVSPKNEGTKPLIAQTEKMRYHDRFAGDLQESQTGVELSRRPNTSTDENDPLWYPGEQVYGLALRGGEFFESSPSLLEFSPDDEGRLRFLLRFLPLERGVILSGILGSAGNAVTLSLSLADEGLLLSLEGQGQAASLTGPLAAAETGPSFAAAEIIVKIRKNSITALLDLGDAPRPAENSPDTAEGPRQADRAEITLNEPVSGTLRSFLGNRKTPSPKTSAEQETKTPDVPAAGELTAVVDDFVVLFQSSTGDEEIAKDPGADPGTGQAEISLPDDPAATDYVL
jgi:hypothetical protein